MPVLTGLSKTPRVLLQRFDSVVVFVIDRLNPALVLCVSLIKWFGGKMLKAILILPFNVLVTVPAIILYFSVFRLISLTQPVALVLMIILFFGGFYLMISSMRLFAAVKHGSPAPWNPVDKLIVTGPYAYMRNPMLSGVFLTLAGECLLFQSWALFYYFLFFVSVNAVYFPLSEEKGLSKRYGKAYDVYKANVPRFIPRMTPWKE